ncbi:DUF421 domain-containing protein [Arundinibacter roseus]|uniref:DUF421 domain-containing protein n=1 Tax=Arundinibacter roseus TaxID=2070510 RepID=A0A4R4KIP4_9BACT|nr:YetF domain-containing protein [Arundinibacter roseus]TDB68100.1 DUF421 domain-containing protein [Arundinibacter roseus]
MEKIFFDTWESLFRTFIITILAYVVLIFMLRSSGKRTLSKMNAFDFIVTIALGSSLATVALNKNVALIDGALAFFLLIYLQYALTWLSVRENKIKKLVTSQPSLLLYRGEFLPGALKKERITEEEVYVAARQKGITSTADIHAVVLETTGTLTVIAANETPNSDAMKNVKNYPG